MPCPAGSTATVSGSIPYQEFAAVSAISAYARAVLCNGLAQYQDALAAATSASEHREVVAGDWGMQAFTERANNELVATGETPAATSPRPTTNSPRRNARSPS